MQAVLKKIPKILEQVGQDRLAASPPCGRLLISATAPCRFCGLSYQVGREIGLEPHKKLKMENSTQYGYYLRIARAVRMHRCRALRLLSG